MARLLIKTPGISPAEIQLAPGCNRLGREGDNEILVPHDSISRHHCEVWLTEEAVLVRDLGSHNGTFVDEARVEEAQVFTGQTLRVGDVQMVLAEAPARVSVPDLPMPDAPKDLSFMPDGGPCCFRHDGIAATLQCGKCEKVFCGRCVRELRLAGGLPRRFCPECGGPCEPLAPVVQEIKRGGWLNKLVDVFTKPTTRN